MSKKEEELNAGNYYTPIMDIRYMSASQYKSMQKCPAETMAKLEGRYAEKESEALTIGRYFDAKWGDPEEMDMLMLESRPLYYTKQGKKRAAVEQADYAYERAYRVPLFREYMSGISQKILKGEIEGVPYKIKMDSYFPGDKIVDLKYMKDLSGGWKDGQKVTFIDLYGYDIQLAIYREIVAQNNGGQYLPCFIAAVTKEAEPDVQIIEIPDWKLNSVMEEVRHYSPIYQEIKEGKVNAPRCEVCDYCKMSRTIEEPISYEDLLTA